MIYTNLLMREKDSMSYSTKATYFPNTRLVMDVTRFGSKKLLSPPNPYVSPLTNKKILVRIDLLVCLKEIWGSSILTARENVYKIVSGDTSLEELHGLLATYYKTHSSFANYVDKIMMFGRRDRTFAENFSIDVHAYLNKYGKYVDECVNKYSGSKFLLEDHEYRYYAVETGCDLSGLEGVVKIV